MNASLGEETQVKRLRTGLSSDDCYEYAFILLMLLHLPLHLHLPLLSNGISSLQVIWSRTCINHLRPAQGISGLVLDAIRLVAPVTSFFVAR